MGSWLRSSLIVISSVGLMFIASCGNSTQDTNKTTSSETTAKTNEVHSSNDGHNHSHTNGDGYSQGGQVIESGSYHLELLPIVEKQGIHLDFFLQKGEEHKSVSNAKVKAQIQLPNGEQKNLDFSYDKAGKHYAAFLPGKATGEYKVVIQTDINGKKVNGRFSFKQ
ncbi:MAG: hypothetical protein F6K50_22820 [Moorea sp. SIO3I7]|uniref:hypothetical protein n=1 Tax=Moorena sp. SIO3I8 TaxID=2607833 RepID=UPI0013C139FD|nr:hypothetical protein [Moorena sp. SIO3I8]NEN98244.1 hypothetical protein [Moorena sp. SIO3I7]NEO04627.1 hypothetical protein [Moorena sp. SIO3I8]